MEISAWRFTLRKFFVIIHILFVIADARAERPYIVMFVIVCCCGRLGRASLFEFEADYVVDVVGVWEHVDWLYGCDFVFYIQ